MAENTNTEREAFRAKLDEAFELARCALVHSQLQGRLAVVAALETLRHRVDGVIASAGAPDMATAAAQGFRDGAASVLPAAGQEPVATDSGFHPVEGRAYRSLGHGVVTFKTMDYERGEPIYHFETSRGIRYMKREQMLRDIQEAQAAAPQPAVAAGWMPMQPIVWAKDGCIRFLANRMVNDLYEFACPRGMGLNEMAAGDYTQEERMQFAQLIGYSVSGYGGLSYVSDESRDKADAIADALPPAPSTEGESNG